MKYLGISEGFHDAGVAVVEDDRLLFASHVERYTRKKNDAWVPDWLKENLYQEFPYDKTVFL